jgi:hypothetical protein
VNDAETEAKVEMPPRVHQPPPKMSQRNVLKCPLSILHYFIATALGEIHTLACGGPRKVAGLTKTQM